MKIEGVATAEFLQPQYGKSETDIPESNKIRDKGKEEQFVEQQPFNKLSSKEQDEKLNEAVEKANKTMETYGTELRFSVHKDSGEIMVKVISTKDKSVVREIPPERILDMVAHFKKMLGIMIDKFI